MNRNKALAINGAASLIYQIIMLLCGLILPKMIIINYGSDSNGVVASVTQFVSIATLIQGGVTSAVRVALYKPITLNDKEAINEIYSNGRNYFNKIVLFFVFYIIFLSWFYPLIVRTDVSLKECVVLIITIGISAIIDNLFGILDQLVLFADQKAYINTILLIGCNIISTCVCVIAINSGLTIVQMKMLGAFILMIRPVVLHLYVKKKYKIELVAVKKAKNDFQSREALAKSIAFYVHYNTDNIIISTFLGGAWASVYSVHRYVFGSVSSLVSSVLGNTEATIGNMIAMEENEKISNVIPVYDLLSKVISSVFFTSAMILISPFIELYTRGITDINYNQHSFAILMCLGEMIYTMSLTYNNIVMAAGHIKETQWISICEAIINISLSMFLVRKYGIIGTGIGTLVAFAFNTVANFVYVNRNICRLRVTTIVKEYLVTIVPCVSILWIYQLCEQKNYSSYGDFIINSIIVFLISSIIICSSCYLFFRKSIKDVITLRKK